MRWKHSRVKIRPLLMPSRFFESTSPAATLGVRRPMNNQRLPGLTSCPWLTSRGMNTPT
ncbi:hypothetical protein D3C80_1877600 [compost metagenome]